MSWPSCDLDEENLEHCDGIEHDGYVHAETWQDVSSALLRGEDVFDKDGDVVTAMMPGGDGLGYYYRHQGETGQLTCTGSSSLYVLILDDRSEPVTEEEMEMVRRSLGVGNN